MDFSRTHLPITFLVMCLAFFLVPISFVYALVNINTASQSELETLTGIGASKAQAIIDYRNTSGNFQSIVEIKNVSGIGDATYDKIKDDITVGSSNDDFDDEVDKDQDTDLEEETGEEEVSTSSRPRVSVHADIQVSATTAVPGMDIRFEGFEEAALQNLKPSYHWNFGDGNTGRGSVIHHAYAEPGSYVVSLLSKRYDKKEYDTITIDIIKPDIVISSVMPGQSGYIEIQNNTDTRVDFSGWRLQNGVDGFWFPERTYIGPKSSAKFPANVVEMIDMNNIKLFDTQGEIVSFYSGYQEVVPNSFFQKNETTIGTDGEIVEQEEVVEETQQLAAAGLESEQSRDGDKGWWIWVSALLGIILVSSGVLFLMQPKSKSAEILSADDIEVIE